MLSYQLISGPIVEPITLVQAKQQLRVDFSEDDTLITGLITAARQIAERYTRRAFYNQTWMLSLDAFPWWNFRDGTINPSERKGWPFYSTYWSPLAIRLPRPRTVTVKSISYRDLSNSIQTLDPSTYSVDAVSEPARIVPMPSLTWPTTQLYLPGSVQVIYEAASFVEEVTEPFTVPESLTYTLLQSPLTNVPKVVDAEGNPVAGVTGGSTLTLPAGSAGRQMTTIYSIGNCPQDLQASMLLLVNHLYENRTPVTEQTMNEVPMSVRFILDMHLFEQFDYGAGY